ncbi:uncharacterized protein VTP21DRAFT_10309 [Calcarisporiella thermophila]|uniref:uncharacterized protein n=1 Tax=Calcarisporiella thermophila TaxID=911321 RepID=UPI003743C877
MEARRFDLNDYPVVIGLDFGTTYSGCAYAFTQDGDVVDIVKWPRQMNSVYPKTPTLNFYKRDSQVMLWWGNAAKLEMMKPQNRDAILLKQYKLALDESQAVGPFPNGLTVLDAISHYLKAFHDHVISELKKGFAKNYNQSQFRYCLTVPAMWSDRAKAQTREAAIRAGLISREDHRDRLMLISEPEAAALYCEKKCEQFNLKHGDRFMICDAGGGTVDLIVFQIDDTPNGRRLRECTKGHGRSCGSVFIDRRMRALLKKRLRNYQLDETRKNALEATMDSFVDLVKPHFDGTEDQFLQLPAALNLGEINNESIGLEGGMLRLSAQELKTEVFDPVIQEVLGLIEDQLHKAGHLQAIFLVGGFGNSSYLFERTKQQFRDRVPLIATPPRAEMAVVRGAVLFGLNPRIVTTRIPRYWYGIDTTTTFEEGVDPWEYRIVRADGTVRCDNRFSVFARRGVPINTDTYVSKSFFAYYPHHTTITLYAADCEDQPRYVTSPGVRKVANFSVPMPVLQGVREGDKVDLTIKIWFGEVELKVEAEIRGKTYSTTCIFDSELAQTN